MSKKKADVEKRKRAIADGMAVAIGQFASRLVSNMKTLPKEAFEDINKHPEKYVGE